MSIDQVKWQTTCCAKHGQYAEHSTRGGGVVRLYRDPAGALSWTRFGADNRAIDKDAAGVPAEVPTSKQGGPSFGSAPRHAYTPLGCCDPGSAA